MGGQNGTMGNATSIDGALIFTDQHGPVIKGTVGVCFPDAPKGQDLHEFSDLSDGVTELLKQEEWQTYFRSRVASVDQEEIKTLLGQHRSRPLVRGCLSPVIFLKPIIGRTLTFTARTRITAPPATGIYSVKPL